MARSLNGFDEFDGPDAATSANRVYLRGHAGLGKTARLAARLDELLRAGVRPDQIVCFAASAGLQQRMRRAQPFAPSGTITTFPAFARRHVALFFPLIARGAGFADPSREPVFLNVEAAQFLLNLQMAEHMPAFDDLGQQRSKLVSQVLDNVNKAAVGGFALDELSDRLASAWSGDSRRLLAYSAAQRAALEYRAYCLRHGVLDYALLIEVYRGHLLSHPAYRDYLLARSRHVLADNVEEGARPMHELLTMLLPECDSALLVEDDPGGYRVFLGADRASARRLAALCEEQIALPDPRVAQPTPAAFGATLARAVRRTEIAPAAPGTASIEMIVSGRYWISMVDAVAARIGELLATGVPAREIVVLAPYVEDVLRFELLERMREHGVTVRTLRPSRPLFQHPAVRAMLVVARLANPHWGLRTTAPEVARMLTCLLHGLDGVRAQLLADFAAKISALDHLPEIEDAALWTRVGLRHREGYRALRGWLHELREPIPLDLWWQTAFTQVLSREGFGLEGDGDAARAVAQLIASARAFRESLQHSEATLPTQVDMDLLYVQMVQDGMLPARYDEEPGSEDGVLLATVQAVLTSDVHSRFQFWLDLQTSGWHERIFQPLTHPYVLAHHWPKEAHWDDDDEHREAVERLADVVAGLSFRCSERIFLASSQLTISGQDGEGWLIRPLQRMLAAMGASAVGG
jgi:hypothetical protein